MKLKNIIIFLLAMGILMASCSIQKIERAIKPRTIVTCDPELDDNNSMIRFILHATDFQIDGLVYTSSRFHWKGDGKGTTQFIEGSEYAQLGLGPQTMWRWSPGERFIHAILDAYEECYENLKVHDPEYPTPEYLRSITVYGNCDFEGDYSADTEGSNLIKKNILDNKPGTLFLQAWGGHPRLRQRSDLLKMITKALLNGRLSTKKSAIRLSFAFQATRITRITVI